MSDWCVICKNKQKKACSGCVDYSKYLYEGIRTDTPKTEISFPILDNLKPTVHTCTMKMIEEVGEVMALIGKEQGQSGEKLGVREQSYLATNMIAEAFDVAQSAVTMAHTLATEYDIDLVGMMEAHRMKLRERGYLK